MTAHPDGRPPVDPAEAGRRLLAEQTPRHRANARRIFERLQAGADADDVKDLIKEFARIDREEPRDRRPGRPAQPDAGRRPAHGPGSGW